MDAHPTPSEETPASRSRNWTRDIAVVVLGLVLGLGFAIGPRILDETNATTGGDELPSGAVPLGSLSTKLVAAAAESAGDAVASVSLEPDPPAVPALSARAAIESFLTAEVDGRYDDSYGFLSVADRSRVGGRAQWVANHANLPPISGFAIETVVEAADDASVVTSTDLRPSLDEIIGLVPAHARGNWTAVREDGGWRVGYSRSRLEPQYPAEALAVDAAREWATARQACRNAAEWEGGLLGPAALATRLCETRGPVTVGPPTELLDDAGLSALTAAFGPDVYAWARVVPVTAPARLELVLAPVGERWLVIGIRETSPGTS